MKKIIKPILYSSIIFLLFIFILTIFNYIGVLPYNIFKIIIIIGIIVMFFINGFLIGKESNKKGWLNGIKIGLILISILFILNLIFKGSFSINTIVGYIVLIIIAILGSMLGINKKNN